MSKIEVLRIENKDRIEPFEGLLAFYDILGYSCIAKASIGDNINKIFSILNKVKVETKEELKTKELCFFYDQKKSDIAYQIDSVIDSIEIENISDSIVSTIRFKKEDKRFNDLITLVFIAFCVRLNVLLFTNGLPVRGSIEKGIYFKQKRILAGSPLINTYKLSESLLFAGVVLTLKTEAQIGDSDFGKSILDLFTAQVKVPTKSGKITLSCLKHSELHTANGELIELRHYVYKYFSQYDKEVADTILDKFENTIDFLMDSKIHSPIDSSRMEKLMAYILGGIAGKLGNRYEARWLIEQYIDLLNEKNVSVQLDSINPEEHGIDVIVEKAEGNQRQCNYFQCKGRDCNFDSWTVPRLRVVIENARKLLKDDRGAQFSIVSPLSFIAYRDFSAIFRQQEFGLDATKYVDVEKFVSHCSNEYKNLWDNLKDVFLSSDEKPVSELLDFLHRFNVVVYPDNLDAEEKLNDHIELFLQNDVDQDMFPLLRDIAEQHLGKPMSASSLISLLEKQGIHRRNLKGDNRILPTIQLLRNEFYESIQLIGRHLQPRQESNTILQLLKDGKNILVVGDKGSGKSVVLYEVSKKLEEQGAVCLPLRLDRHPPEHTPRKFGENLDLPESPVYCIDAVTETGQNGVLILDQVDALRWTSGACKSALDVVKRMIMEAMQLERENRKVSFIIALRKVDYENDPELKQWLQNQASFSHITIPLLTPEEQLQMINRVEAGAFGHLRDRQKQLLQSPHLIHMWEQLVQSKRDVVFINEGDLCRQFIDHCVTIVAEHGFPREQTSQVLDKIVENMEQHNRIWAPSRLCSPLHIQALQSSGLIQITHDKLLFAHQSYLDYQTATKVLESEKTIFQWLQPKRRQDLLRREQLKLVLLFLYDEDIQSLADQCDEMLRSSDIRFHLKHLILTTLGDLHPSLYLVEKVIGWTEQSDLSEHTYLNIFWGHPLWMGELDSRNMILPMLESADVSKRKTIQTLLQAATTPPEMVLKYAATISDPCEKAKILPWSTVSHLDKYIDIRLSLFEEGIIPDFIDLKELVKSFPLETIRLLKFFFEKYRLKKKTEPYLDFDWKLPEPYSKIDTQFSYHDAKSVVEVFAEKHYEQLCTELLPLLVQYTSSEQMGVDDFNLVMRLHHNTVLSSRHSLFTYINELLVCATTDFAKKNPCGFYDFSSRYQPSVSSIADTMIAEAYIFLSDSYSDRVLTWLIERENDFIVYDWRGEGSSWALAKKLIERHSATCSEAVFKKLESLILNNKYSKDIEHYKNYPEGRNYYPFWGRVQHFLLPALDTTRTNDETKGLIGVLERRASVRSFGPDNISGKCYGGMVVSPIHNKQLSDRNWLDIIASRKIKEKAGFSRRQLDEKHIVHSDINSFASKLRSLAIDNPARFVKLLLSIPSNVSIRREYIEAVSNATTNNNYSGTTKKSTPLDVSLCIQFWERYFDKLAEREGRGNFCDMLKNRANETWPDQFYDRLIQLAKTEDDISFYIDHDDLSMGALNTTQAKAFSTMAAFLWEHPELFQRFSLVIEECITNTENPLALCNIANDVCYATLRLNKALAIKWFLLAVQKEPRVVTGYVIINFMNCTMQEYYKEYYPLITGLLTSNNKYVRKFVVSEVVARHLFYGYFNDEFSQILQSSEETDKKTIADVLSKLAQEKKYLSIATTHLIRYVNDQDQSIRSEAWSWISPETLKYSETPPILGKWIQAADQPDSHLLHYLSLCPTLLIFKSVIRVYVDKVTELGQDSQHYYVYHDLPSVLLRLYEEAKAEMDTACEDMCMDAWDKLFKSNLFNVRKLSDDLNSYSPKLL